MPWLILLLTLAFTPIVERRVAAEILVVRASDADPYAQAEAGLRERLAATHQTVRAETLKSVSEKGLVAAIGKADTVVAIGTPAAKWLQKQLPQTVRLVYCMVNNAEEAGLATGRPAWGVTTDVAFPDQLKVISEAIPAARTVGILYRSDAPEARKSIESLTRALPEGWRVEAVAANESPSVAAAIEALIRKRPDLIWTTADPKLYDTACVRSLLLAALRSKIPVFGFSPAFVRAGGLVGVGVDPKAQGRQAAGIIQLLTGTKSDDAVERVQTAHEFQVAINLIVARQLGIDIPDSLARRATFIFKTEN